MKNSKTKQFPDDLETIIMEMLGVIVVHTIEGRLILKLHILLCKLVAGDNNSFDKVRIMIDLPKSMCFIEI